MKFKGTELNGTYTVEYYDDWFKMYDSKGNVIYYEDSRGFWFKSEYDSNGNQIYFENSKGYIEDARPKTELTLKEIADKFNIDVNKLRIKEDEL